MRNQLMAGAANVASRFAHLAGLGRKVTVAAKAEEDEDKKDDDKEKAASDDDKEKCEDDDKDDKEASRAEDDEKDDEEKSSKGSKAEDEDDEDDEDDKKEAKAVRRGVRSERKRVAAVLGSRHVSVGNIAMAAAMLCESDASAETIVAALKASSSASVQADRRGRNPNIDATGQSFQGGDRVAASWETAMKRAVGGRR